MRNLVRVHMGGRRRWSINRNETWLTARPRNLLSMDPENQANMLCQARAQIDLGGTAVVKTIGKMLGQQESARILQRVALPRGRVGTTPKQRVATKYTSTYVRACRALFGPFDGQGYMELNQLRPMLERHRLLDPHDEGAAAKLDAWLQRPRDGHITFLDFVDACFTLVGPSLAAKWMDGTTSRHDMSPTTSLSTVSTATDSRLHPFDAMKDQHKHAMEFSYADHVETDPMQAQRLQDATTLSHSHSLVMDTPYRCIRRVVSEQDLHEQAAGDTAKKAVKVKAQRHLASEHRKKVEARQAHARNFSCSVGMVARHIQIGEIKEKRQLGLQERVALVNWRKQDDQRSRSEMEDFNAVRGTTLSAVEHSFLVYAVACQADQDPRHALDEGPHA
ncbi:hypothetical protein, variant [Aphanomyces invadans]|uniref:EF-hand domain-containing protein n=1 Tax=Aphanomyces invadans TaxID=157072 RepID=A0A024TTP5_9STRA|nr:hypothetical protein, variant [Aphanomyces invadans]ETV97525.1 hypothetical protein, variant [Aphanomyces invadans]|eukprot:XP_008873734.1 hypothetical protein, variant [Aphanomyces invadans]